MSDPTNPLLTATSLGVGTSGTHTLNATTANDYYRFTLSGRSSVHVTLSGLDSNADVQLLTASGLVLQASTNTGTTTDDINSPDLGAGVYYIRVFAANGSSSAHYTLGVQAVTNARTDLLWRNYSTGANAIWTMNGTTLVSGTNLQTIADLNWRLETAADFNSDGQADLVWRNYSTGENLVWFMQGNTSMSYTTVNQGASASWHINGTADFNGDGQTDLLWRNYSTGENLVWLMNGTTSMTAVTLPPIGDRNWQINGTGDFNSDGQADLVWRNYSTGENLVWLMQGTTYSTFAALPALGDLNWRISGTGDFNGDGQSDLVWRNYSTGADAIWLMSGTTLLPNGGVYFTSVSDTNWQIAAPFTRYGVPGDVHLGGTSTTSAFDLGTLNGQATYQSTLNSSGYDYYRFTLTAAKPNVYARVTASQLDLLASSGSVLQSAAPNGGLVRLQHALDSGTYYLRVSGGQGYTLVVADTTAPPTVTANLVNDTARGGTDHDHRTADPTVAVQVGTEHWLDSLSAGFSTTNPSQFLDLSALLGNSFTLTPTLLQQINGGVALTEGAYVLRLRAKGVDAVTTVTTDLSFTFDATTSAPSGLHLTTGTGNTTNDTTPTVTGQAEAGALVKVYGAGNVLLGQGVADSTGIWQATLSALTDGTYNVTAIATDVAGNVSVNSAALSLTLDTALPTLNVTTALTIPLVSSTRLTGTVNGTGSAIAAISYHFDERPAIALAFDPATGAFDQVLDFTGMTSGTHTLTLTTTDTAGNVKTLQTPVTVALGDAPTITAALAQDTAPGGYTNDDGITHDPTLSGQVTTTQPLSVLRAGFGTTGTGVNYVDITAQVQADGSFTLNRAQLETLYGGTLVDAHYTLSLQAVDTAGNVTTLSPLAFDLDTQAPAAPSNLSLAPAGMYAVAITGTAEAGAQVQLFAGTTLVGEAVANAAGHWRVTTSQLRNGTHSLTATASDAAGNTSPATTATDVTITTLVPSTPQGLRLTALTDSGESNSDNITNDATPTIVGTAEAGATVRLLQGQQLLGETTADVTTGTWSIALTTALPEGEQSLSVVAQNAIGDSQTATLLTTIDTVVPTTTQLHVLATGSTTATALANGVTLTTGTRLLGQVNGTTSAVASLQYQLGTNPAVTVPVAANGLFNYLLAFTDSSSGDNQTLSVILTDVAGNTTTLAPFTVNVAASNNGEGGNSGGDAAPVLLARLLQDTGSDTTDGWTAVPGIAGVASGAITALLATFDTAPTADFQDLTLLLGADGTFALDEETLAALAGGDLADGAYTLRLRVQAGATQMTEQLVSFTLDRTAPVTTLPNLIDGIAWERGTHLQGTVVEASAGVNVVYQLETVNGVAVGSSQTLAVTDQAFDQVLDAATLTAETPYNLVLTSTDRAGNSQRSRFQFFIPSERKVTDDDTLPGGSSNTGDLNPPDPANATVGNVGSWGYVGSGGWGYWGGYPQGGGSGGFTPTPGVGFGPTPPPNADPNNLEGSGYEFTYVESVNQLVNKASDLISTDPNTIKKKAALVNRRELLQGLGERLSGLIHGTDGNFKEAADQVLIDRLRPAMEGLFADAYAPAGRQAGVEPGYVLSGGAWLAQALVTDQLSVREQVFQATLLAVVTEATLGVTDVAQQQALTTAVMALAKTYAWLNPNPEATVPAGEQDFGFLDALWRLQIPDASGAFKDSGEIAQMLENSVAALGRLLVGVQDPVRAIQFLNNLVQAASNVTSLKADVKDATFLRELVEFGVEFVQTNPTVNATATDTAMQGFLDRLWRGDTQQVKQAQGGLNAFFAGMETAAERIKGLEFAGNLIDAADLLQGEGLVSQKDNPVFLDALIGLGGAYAALDPLSVAADAENLEFFLDTLYDTQEQTAKLKGTEELGRFFNGFSTADQQLQLLQFGRKQLQAFDFAQDLKLQEQLRQASSIDEMLGLGALYVSGQLADEVVIDPSSFLSRIWSSQKTSELEYAASQLQNFSQIISSNESYYNHESLLISLPENSVSYATPALVIPIVGIAVVVYAGGVAVYWQRTSKDREEVIRVAIDKTKDTATGVTNLIIGAISSAGVLAGKTAEGCRGLIEDFIQQKFFPIKGPQLRGNTEQLAAHLARLLRKDRVGGVPSGEPPDPGNDNDNHWWKEIGTFLINIQSATKGASRKQVLRELRKRFTDEQITEIERNLVEAANRMGQSSPPFLPR